MLEEASTLLTQKKEVEAKQQLLESFCQHFLISDQDLTTLTSSAEPISEHFFDVLAKVKQIRRDCEILLGYENQRLGLELMEQTTRDLNAGYKKLFNSTLRAFRGLDLEDPNISGSIRRSLRALSERPALFQSCLDSFAEARQSTVSDAFHKALTDSTLGATRAIDFSTHDPLRYIGDMLAWVHSATVSEMEALEGLFISDADEISRGLHKGRSEDPFSLTGAGDEDGDGGQDVPYDGHTALNSLVSRNMASVIHMLTQRISITVRNLSEPVEIYKAYNILSFYRDMFWKVVRRSANADSSEEGPSVLLSTVIDLQSQIFKHFETVTLQTLHSSIDETPNPDLSPPAILSNILTQFSIIARTRGPNLDLPEFTKLYSTLLAPTLKSCGNLADLVAEGPDATAASKTIYQLNYLSCVCDALSQLISGPNSIAAATKPLQAAKDEIESLQSELEDVLSETFLAASGLDQLRRVIDEAKQSSKSPSRQKAILIRPPANQDGGSANPEPQMENLARRLDTFLAAALMDTQDDLAKLVDKAVAKSVLNGAVASFMSKFNSVVDALEAIDEGVEREGLARKIGKANEVNGGTDASDSEEEDTEVETDGDELKLRDVYPRTVSEVEALLS